MCICVVLFPSLFFTLSDLPPPSLTPPTARQAPACRVAGHPTCPWPGQRLTPLIPIFKAKAARTHVLSSFRVDACLVALSLSCRPPRPLSCLLADSAALCCPRTFAQDISLTPHPSLFSSPHLLHRVKEDDEARHFHGPPLADPGRGLPGTHPCQATTRCVREGGRKRWRSGSVMRWTPRDTILTDCPSPLLSLPPFVVRMMAATMAPFKTDKSSAVFEEAKVRRSTGAPGREEGRDYGTWLWRERKRKGC